MKKIFNKVLAGVTSAALVATLLVGINVASTVKADGTSVDLNYWTFTRGGVEYQSEYLNGNEGRINSVTMNGTNEVLTDWKTLSWQEEKKTATTKATGFTMDIANTGWDQNWDTGEFNPWQIQAQMNDVVAQPGHIYTVSFKAHASKKKYCYVAFGSTVDGVNMAPYDQVTPTGSKQTIAITPTEATYTYTFTNWVSAKSFSTTLFLGNFATSKDYAGNDVSDVITEPDNAYAGQVYISDFTITDEGKNPDFVDVPPIQTTTANNNNNGGNNNNNGGNVNPPANTTPQAPATVKKLAKVKKLKAVSKKKGTVKITWKKVKSAKSYQVKVGKKTYNTKKVKLTVKKVKKGKVVVKVRAKAAGFKTSAWATKKVKVK